MNIFNFTKPHLNAAQGTLTKGHVSAQGLELSFNVGGRKTIAVASANIDIEPGEFVCLLGPSGCGKSTLLNAIAGFITPSAGEARLDGAPITRPNRERGMVFQSHSLFPWKTVLGNVMHGPLMGGHSKREAESTARTFLDMVGLADHAKSFPKELSGGMNQRVGIARALANYPSVLLMDEPFGALDAETRAVLQMELLQLWEELRITIIFVTHDIDEAVFLSDRILVMSASPGRIVEDIAVRLSRPRDTNSTLSAEFIDLKRRCLNLIRENSAAAFGRGRKNVLNPKKIAPNSGAGK